MLLARPHHIRALGALCARNGAAPSVRSLELQGVHPGLSATFSSSSTTQSKPDSSESPAPPFPSANWSPTSDVRASSSTASKSPSADWTPTSDVGIETDLKRGFLDSKRSFEHLSDTDLLRANVVLQACGMIGPAIPYIDKFYNAAVAVAGPTLLHEKLMRPTLFDHFCGGEAAQDLLPKMKSLQEYGVGGILDYAAEAKEGDGAQDSNESRYDAQIELFKEAIAIAEQGGNEHNLVAIKISALCDVPLLTKASKGLVEAQRVFFRLANASGEPGEEDIWGVPFAASPATVLDQAAFERGWPDGELRLENVDVRGVGHVDLVDWTAFWTLARISAGLTDCACAEGFAVLSVEELACLARAKERIDAVCANAREHGVRLLVDAEWSKSQPAMDYLAWRASAAHNVLDETSPDATVLQTYQCYLRGSLGRCERDLVQARREGWLFGAKLVRGAYIVQEKAEAIEAGRVSPIWDSLPLTAENYEAAIGICLANHRQGNQVMVASHNPDSLLFTVRKMRELKLDPQTSGILFGQLLGMAEAVSFSLAKHGYRVFKYMPYGALDDVVPYLLRRTQENSTLLGSPAVDTERQMLLTEMLRRNTGVDLSWAIRRS